MTNGIVTSPLFRLSYDTDNVRGRPVAASQRSAWHKKAADRRVPARLLATGAEPYSTTRQAGGMRLSASLPSVLLNLRVER